MRKNTLISMLKFKVFSGA